MDCSERTMQDCETGERRTLDHETGESLKPVHVWWCDSREVRRDAETGEPEVKSQCRQRHFQVPRHLYEHAPKTKRRPEDLLRQRPQSEICCLEKKMVSGSQNMSPVVFMLPTLFMCPAWATVLCCMVEVCIHVWAHKCNKIYNDGIFYKSPLHMVTSEFCARCRSDRVMQTVGKLQDERKLKLDNKKLRGYVESVSSLVTKI